MWLPELKNQVSYTQYEHNFVQGFNRSSAIIESLIDFATIHMCIRSLFDS